MFYKYNTNFINLIIIFIIILNLNCKKKSNKHCGKAITKNLTILDFSKNYNLSSRKDKFIFVNHSKSRILTGGIFSFKTKNAILYKSIVISNLQKQKKSSLTFKLYVNNKFLGKYNKNDSIIINKKVFSFKIIFIKTGNEKIYNAWDENYTYKFIKNNKQQINNRLKIELFSYNNSQYNNVVFFRTKKNKFSILKYKKENILFPKTVSISIITNKKSQFITENTFSFNSNGSFYIHQLEASKNNLKIQKDFFYEGNWRIRKYNFKTILELSGYISGYFANNKNKYFETEFYNSKAIIEETKIISNSLLSSFNVELPEASFVNIKEFTKNVIVEMPYSTENNFTGIKLYPCNRCYLRYKIVKDFIKANNDLNKLNYRIKIFDCYRPFYVQAIMFKKFPVKGYVADSIGGSVHNRGGAIDLTITDNKANEINMGTSFDDLSYKSNHNYKYFSDTVLNNRLLLKKIMIKNNFLPINSEWWHYNHKNARVFKKTNIDFPCK